MINNKTIKLTFLFAVLLVVPIFLSGCLPEVGLEPKNPPAKAVFTELFEHNGITYGYNIVYDGDYTKLSQKEQHRLVQTELIEKTDYKTEVIYKSKGVVHYNSVGEFEKTGDSLYFYTSETKNEYSIYSYNTKTGMFRCLSEAPGTMLIIPDGDYGYGWIAKDATLFAVNLNEGTIDNDKTYNLENSELLFYAEGQEFDKKITCLYSGTSDTVICLDVQYYSEGNSNTPSRSYTYLFETLTQTFVGPFENILLN